MDRARIDRANKKASRKILEARTVVGCKHLARRPPSAKRCKAAEVNCTQNRLARRAAGGLLPNRRSRFRCYAHTLIIPIRPGHVNITRDEGAFMILWMGTFQDRTSTDRILFPVFSHENKSQGSVAAAELPGGRSKSGSGASQTLSDGPLMSVVQLTADAARSPRNPPAQGSTLRGAPLRGHHAAHESRPNRP